jgi:SAM-dependent methyltransferase
MTTLDLVRRSLRERTAVRDEDFDLLYPLHVRAASQRFWTPVQVALRAAELLVGNRGGARVLDVGSGPGKLCLVGALTTSGHFTGVEQRPQLVNAARGAASHLRVESSVSFVQGGLDGIDWSGYDAFYFYNPFMENMYSPECHYDGTIELSATRFVRDVAVARRGLRRAREGARVVTYHGLGDELPDPFHLEHSEVAGSDCLEVWVCSSTRKQRS